MMNSTDLLHIKNIVTSKTISNYQHVIVEFGMSLDLTIQNEQTKNSDIIKSFESNMLKVMKDLHTLPSNEETIYIVIFPYSLEFSFKYWLDLINYYVILHSKSKGKIPCIIGLAHATDKANTEEDRLLEKIEDILKYIRTNLEYLQKQSTKLDEHLYKNDFVSSKINNIVLTILKKEGLELSDDFEDFSLENSKNSAEVSILNQIYQKYNDIHDILNSL